MHNLAIALHKKGYQVSGSDDEIFEPSKSRLTKYNILPKQIGWDENIITKELDAVILGMHAKPDNPELQAAQAMGLKIYSYPEYVYEQSKNKKRIIVAGSHGKTSITSMVLHVLKHQKTDFDYLVGAQLEGFETMVRLSDAPIIVIEGDEYLSSPIDRKPKFLWYKPHVAVISGIAWDHINVFPTYDNYVDQFDKFCNLIENDDLIILDTRNELSFGAAHIPGSISIWKDGLASFAGWFLTYDKDIIIITPDLYPEDEVKILHRLGFDKISGYLSGGMLKWHMAGIRSSSIGMIKVQKVCDIFDSSNDYWILDIRSKDELKNTGEITDAHHIHLTQLPNNIEKIPQNSPIYIFCGSGLRSNIAASILKREGFDNINVILGGLEGWSSTSCPIV
jgi:UDP-N-acetylmuramate-alanine ligase